MAWTKDTIVKISLTGKRNTITCNACGAKRAIPLSDEFQPGTIKVPHQDGDQERMVKSPKELCKVFAKSHLAAHTPKPEPAAVGA